MGISLNRIIKLFLCIVLVVSLVSVVYLVVFHNPGEGYTEFYLLDYDENITDYPINLSSGSVHKLLLGIKNQEHKGMDYTVKVKKEDEVITEYNISLEDKKSIEIPYFMDCTRLKGENQTLNFELYKSGEDAVYRKVFLRFNVV